MTVRRFPAVLGRETTVVSRLEPRNMVQTEPCNVLFEHFFDLPTFFHLCRFCSALPSTSKVRVVRDLSGRLFDFAFHFVKSALSLTLVG
jgi:hypothetical protein